MRARIKDFWGQFRYRHVVLELLISVCLACLVWVYIHNRTRISIDRVAVPVQVQLAPQQRDQYVLEVSEQRSVTVSFTGTTGRIREIRRQLQRGLLKAMLTLTVPEEKKAEAMFTETLRVDEDAISVPASIKLEISDETVPVTVHRLTERALPVKLEITGDARVSQIKIEPATVMVRGPKAVLDRASFIATQPVGIQIPAETPAGNEANVRDQATLVTELDGRPVQANPSHVQFRCRAVPKQKIYDLVDVPIHFLYPKDSPWKARFDNERDSKTTLKLIGPVTEQAPPVLAFVDLTAGNLGRGRNLEPLRLQLPKDFQLVQPATPLVTFYLEERERPMTTTMMPKIKP